MADLGTKIEPGIVTNVSSATTVTTEGQSPSNVGIVGQADLGGGAEQGSANPNEVYLVTRSTDARGWFGDQSLLTEAVTDALNEGAFPVYAVATEEQSITGEDISSITSTSGTLAEGPISEDPTDTQFEVDATSKTTVITYEDPTSMSPDAGEVYLNPVTGEFELDAAPSDSENTNDTVDYPAHDYLTANQALVDSASEAIDFFVPLSERLDVKTDVQTKVNNMAQEYNFAMAIVGAGARIDPIAYENSFDDSRVQVIYPTRGANGMSVLGAYAGLRASIGLTTTPINKRLDAEKDLAVSLDKAQRGELINSFVTPLDEESAGARIADDVNSVSDDNSDEANIRFGFTRLVVDFVIETVHINERPFIGRLNSQAVRSTLQGLLNSELKPLKRTNSIIDYSVSVRPVDATTATVELGIETAKPLRFIENEIAVGDSQ